MQSSHSPNADASPEFIQNISDLVHAKTAWAADIRDLHANGDVPVKLQKTIWHDHIATAEKAIAARKLPDAQLREGA
jgi:hypothetical protein